MRTYADVMLMEVAAFAGRKRFDPKMVWKVSRELLKPHPQWWDGLSRMTMPVLAIGGGKASYLRQDRLRDVVHALPDARIVTIDGGHRTHITKGDEFCDVAVPFLTNGKYVNRRHNGIQDM